MIHDICFQLIVVNPLYWSMTTNNFNEIQNCVEKESFFNSKFNLATYHHTFDIMNCYSESRYVIIMTKIIAH